jgi:hypothetical protein
MEQEWDWPPTRRRRFYRTIEYRPPSGWRSPTARKAVRIYWRVTITIIKALFAIPLSILAIAAFWFLWITLTIFYSAIVHRLVA